MEWIWNSSFAEWVSTTGDLFWIQGKPASGKSTLIEYISRSVDLQDRLRQCVNDEWTVVHHYFYDFGPDKDMLNNFEGFLRSLLYQLIKEFRGINREFGQERVTAPEAEPEQQRSIQTLKKRLTIELEHHSNPILILLDGLDEYQGDMWDLALFLKDIARFKVKLCMASRPNPVYKAEFKNLPTLDMMNFNTPAISKMVTLELQKWMTGSDFDTDQDVVLLAEDIATKANGVFLWAHFAILQLRDGRSEGDSLTELRDRLQVIPKKLEDIYAKIFRNLNMKQRQEAAHMLQLVCYAKRILTVCELFVATAYAASEERPRIEQVSACDIDKFERKILTVTGGVLEVNTPTIPVIPPYSPREQRLESWEPGSRVRVVALIHKTLRTYLDIDGWSQLLNAPHEGLLHAQALWLRVCAGMFRPSFEGLPRARQLSLRRDPGQGPPHSYPLSRVRDRVSPLLNYAAEFMLDHAGDVECFLGLVLYDMIQPAMSDSFLNYHCSYHCANSCLGGWRPLHPLHPLHLAIGHGLDGYVRDFLSKFHENFEQGSREWDKVFLCRGRYR